MDGGILYVAEREHHYLEGLAREGAWDYDDYASERDILKIKFESFIPAFVTYSSTVLLHSIVETQLLAFANHVGETRSVKLQVKDIAGQGVEQSALYLKLGFAIDVKTDRAWSRLKDLQSLRNIFVHRGGRPGISDKHRKSIDDLIKRYPNDLELRRVDGFNEQIWMSMILCREFAKEIEGFFERLFKTAGLPNRHMQLES